MKNIVLKTLIIISIFYVSVVCALTPLDYEEFKENPEFNEYEINSTDNGISAFKELDSGGTINISYYIFDSEKEAKKEYDTVCQKNDKAVDYDNFNVNDEQKVRIFSNISCDFTEKKSAVHSYINAYYVDNFVLLGNTDINNKEEANKKLDSILTLMENKTSSVTEEDDEAEKKEEPTKETVPSEEKKEEQKGTQETGEKKDNSTLIIILIGVLVIAVIVLVIALTNIFKDKKSENTSE